MIVEHLFFHVKRTQDLDDRFSGPEITRMFSQQICNYQRYQSFLYVPNKTKDHLFKSSILFLYLRNIQFIIALYENTDYFPWPRNSSIHNLLPGSCQTQSSMADSDSFFTDEEIDKLNIVGLKNYLRRHNQFVTGKKSELVERAKGVRTLGVKDSNQQEWEDHAENESRQKEKQETPLGCQIPHHSAAGVMTGCVFQTLVRGICIIILC